jgi:hypothetical protein
MCQGHNNSCSNRVARLALPRSASALETDPPHMHQEDGGLCQDSDGRYFTVLGINSTDVLKWPLEYPTPFYLFPSNKICHKNPQFNSTVERFSTSAAVCSNFPVDSLYLNLDSSYCLSQAEGFSAAREANHNDPLQPSLHEQCCQVIWPIVLMAHRHFTLYVLQASHEPRSLEMIVSGLPPPEAGVPPIMQFLLMSWSELSVPVRRVKQFPMLQVTAGDWVPSQA